MGKQAILCIDDESVVLKSLKEQLKRHLGKEYYIEVASSGKEALAAFEELQADGLEIPLVISDEIMPQMTGDRLLIEIHRRSPQTLKIMLTGQASADGVGNAVNKANLYRYITKPWDETDLLLTVTEALRRYQQERQLAEQNEALRQMNGELERLNSSLEQKVSDRTAQLLQAKQAAEVANRAKSRFLASMSHELRTPLNAILGFSQILAYESSLSPKQRENIQIINRSGGHLLALINDVLDLAKIEAGQLTLNPKSFDLHDVLQNLREMLELKAASKGLRLNFDCDPDLPRYIKSDESKLRQVLLNLLGNAIKFTAAGQVTLRVQKAEDRSAETPRRRKTQGNATPFGNATRTADRQEAKENKQQATGAQMNRESETGMNSSMSNGKAPHLPNSPSPHSLYFEVEDTGPGIATEELDSLFDPFVQTETGRQSMEGTGLGLPISQEFVRLMGGEITVCSELGRGSTFSFKIRADREPTVPVPQNEGEMAEQRVTGLAGDSPAYSILVVEDVAENRQLILALLEPLGFEVKVAENGREALDLWQTWQPHLILMDMRMPVMDGYAATQAIKATPQGQETPIIALTASAFAEEQQAMRAAGCDDFICKPFLQDLLFAKLSAYLDLSYRYDTTSPLPTLKSVENFQLSPAQIAALQSKIQQMPVEWAKNLQSAAVEIDDQQVLALVEEIPKTETDLIEVLVNLVENFRCDLILDLIQRGD